MLDQMRTHHRCVEGEMARRADGGRAMPDRAAMGAMMERCPMPMAMRESMMMMHGAQNSPAEPSPPEHEHTPDPPVAPQ
jgi:hypothetical protein